MDRAKDKVADSPAPFRHRLLSRLGPILALGTAVVAPSHVAQAETSRTDTYNLLAISVDAERNCDNFSACDLAWKAEIEEPSGSIFPACKGKRQQDNNHPTWNPKDCGSFTDRETLLLTIYDEDVGTPPDVVGRIAITPSDCGFVEYTGKTQVGQARITLLGPLCD